MVRRTTRALGLLTFSALALRESYRTGSQQDAFAAPSEARGHAGGREAAKKQWGVSRAARKSAQASSARGGKQEELAVSDMTLGSMVGFGLLTSGFLGGFAGAMGAMYGSAASRMGLVGMASLLALGVGCGPLMERIKKALLPWAADQINAGKVAPASAAEQEPTRLLRAVLLQALALLAAIGAALGAYGGRGLALKGVGGIFGLYAIMSFNEYVIHRYYQHLGINKAPWYRFLRRSLGFPHVASSGHVEHHKETNDDMTLDRRPDANLDADPFRGTAFDWSVTGMMMSQIAVQSYPFLWLCGWSLQASTIAFGSAMMLHAMVWQALHPAMHQLPDPPLLFGVPGWGLKMFRNSTYFRCLYVNHEGHHRYPGAHGNYNVCCPLFDHVMGTYRGVIPPQTA